MRARALAGAPTPRVRPLVGPPPLVRCLAAAPPQPRVAAAATASEAYL
eukprot:gene5464-5666_t